MNDKKIGKHFGAELRKAARQFVGGDLPAPILLRLDELRAAELKSSRGACDAPKPKQQTPPDRA